MSKLFKNQRVLATSLAVVGSAAITATLLWMFQDDEIKEIVNEAAKNRPKPLAPGIEQIGDGSEMADFSGALMIYADRAKKQPTRVGYFNGAGGAKIVVVSTPEHVAQVLSKATAHALWGGIKPASEAFFGQSVLFVLEGEEWKHLRGIIRNAFKISKLDVMKGDVSSTAIDLASRLSNYEGKVVDMNSALGLYHLACIAKSSFGIDLDIFSRFPEPNDIGESFEFLLNELQRRAFHPDQGTREDYVTPTAENIAFNTASGVVRKAVLKAIEQRFAEERYLRSKGAYVPRGDLLDSMLQAYREETTGQFIEAQVLSSAISDNLIEMYFAGYNTTVVTMSVALHALARDPKLAKSIQKEIDANLPTELPYGYQVNPSDFPSLTRLMREALRTTPPAPLVSRLILEPITLSALPTNDGKETTPATIPANTVVWFPVEYLGKDPASWGKDVDEFNPDRFLKAPVNGSFIPFSYGARDCVGKFFAEFEFITVMSVLLQRFNFSAPEDLKFVPMFTGFGYRPFDATTNKVSMRLIPTQRTDISTNMNEWSTPTKRR